MVTTRALAACVCCSLAGAPAGAPTSGLKLRPRATAQPRRKKCEAHTTALAAQMPRRVSRKVDVFIFFLPPPWAQPAGGLGRRALAAPAGPEPKGGGGGPGDRRCAAVPPAPPSRVRRYVRLRRCRAGGDAKRSFEVKEFPCENKGQKKPKSPSPLDGQIKYFPHFMHLLFRKRKLPQFQRPPLPQ